MPYRDFLTPQLPAFLLPGGLVMRLVGPSAGAVRLLAALLALGAGVWTWMAARRMFGPAVAALAGTVVLLHPAVFADLRTYRPDPFMLFFATLGVLLFVRGAFPRGSGDDPPSRRWLAAAGVAFGLATLSKLFGPLPLAGCILWLASDGRARGRPWRAVLLDGLAALVPVGLVVGVGLGGFVLLSSSVVEATVGHHLRQGAGLPPWRVVWKGLVYVTEVLRGGGNGLLAAGAVAAAVRAVGDRDRRALLVAWQLPTAAVFLVLSRQLFVRHVVYLVPALAMLLALLVVRLISTHARARDDRPRLVAAAVAFGLLAPWLIEDWHRAWWVETGTARVGDLVQLVTAPGDVVLSDYSELNFYAGRRTTYSGASLSEGALRSGQIAFADATSPHRLRDELAADPPALVVLDRDAEFAHLTFLADRPAFDEWLEEGFGHAGAVRRDHQTYDVYAPNDRPLPLLGRFGPLSLLAAGPTSSEVEAGSAVEVRAAWRADEAPGRRLVASVALLDGGGREWGRADEAPRASGSSGTRLRASEQWSAGELTADRIRLQVPAGTPPGDYSLTVDVYDQASAARLAAVDADGRPLGRRVVAGSLRVTPGTPRVPAGAIDLRSDARGGGLRLLGRGPLPDGPVRAGSTFPLELWWTADGLAADAAVSVTLVDPTRGAAAAERTEPLGVPGTAPDEWPEGLLVRQPVRIPVRADAPSGEYRVSVSLPGREGSSADLGAVAVEARDLSSVVTAPPEVEHAVGARVAAVAELVGYSTSPTAGGVVTVTLVWRALDTPPTSYRATVQLLDANGTVVAQHDGEPALWTRPTTGWLPGEIVVDEHPLDLPDGVRIDDRSHRLVVALYDPESLRRLPVSGPGAAGDLVELGSGSTDR